MKGEFEFINALRAKYKSGNLSSNVKIGIGDDCAVIKQNNKTDLVISTDLLVEDVDFRLAWTKPEYIGHKALAVSLSDVAAMGAQPLWALVSIGVPANIWQSAFVERFYQGWFGLAKKFNVDLVGGDVSRTPDKIVIDSIVAGEVKRNQAILRSGAQVGDLIFVTGKLGGAAGGLKLFESGSRLNTAESEFELNLLQRQLFPDPQIAVGDILSKNNLATAMIDLSDGLSSDLTHLCIASKVGAEIKADKIPIDDNLTSIPELSNDAFSLSLSGGEDFELLFTVNSKNEKKLEELLGNVSCIGKIKDKPDEITLLKDSGAVLLLPEGFRHF
jgi:thiamine-monophosphate kinase